jgi:NADH:ubiquinone oxidoreductase subunit D
MLWAFEGERIMEFYERVSGHRMHAASDQVEFTQIYL